MATQDLMRVGSFGFTLEAVLEIDGQPADISGATLLELRFRKPDGTSVHRVAQLGTTGLDGLVVYLVQAGDIDQPGEWAYQFDVATPTFRYPLDPVAFTVGENIP